MKTLRRAISGMLPVLALVAACSSTQTVTLPNGATGYPIACRKVEACEARSREICGANYRVHERFEHRIEEEKQEPLSRTSTAKELGEVTMGSRLRDPSEHIDPWWSVVVECNPQDEVPSESPADGSYAQALARHLAALKENKDRHMEAVCKLHDPEMRREELLIAKEEFRDQNLSCDSPTAGATRPREQK